MSIFNKIKQAVGLEGTYKASLFIFGNKFEASGGDVREAIENLKPSITKGKAILSIVHGDKKVEKILGPVIVPRLFSQSPMTRQIALKNVCMLFNL